MRSGFFNSTITGYDEEGMPIFDRAEDATFFAKYFSRIVGNGIFADPGDGMMVQSSNGMNLTVKSGVCFINGYMGWLESDEMITVDAAHAILDRIDMIVADTMGSTEKSIFTISKERNQARRCRLRLKEQKQVEAIFMIWRWRRFMFQKGQRQSRRPALQICG